MTVRELINQLLNCDMDAEIRIGYAGKLGDDIEDIVYDEFERKYAIKST